MSDKKAKEKNNSYEKKNLAGIITLVTGLVALVAGVIFLVIALNRQPDIHDAKKLTAVGSWQREDQPDVVWNFTDAGKGTLTTNGHTNDYDFIWTLVGNRLLIETDWLYTLNDEFDYEIKDGRLVLNDKIVFVPVES